MVVNSSATKMIENLPRVSGGGEPYLSNDAVKVLQNANDLSKKEGDQFVSLEFILLALLNTPGQVATLLKDAGMSEKELKLAIAELRKGGTVNSQSAEDSYDSLNRYAINLNEKARSGKLDPVIGRENEILRVIQTVFPLKAFGCCLSGLSFFHLGWLLDFQDVH